MKSRPLAIRPSSPAANPHADQTPTQAMDAAEIKRNAELREAALRRMELDWAALYSLPAFKVVALLNHIESQQSRIAALTAALRECADRLETCAHAHGNSREMSAIVVEEYRNLLLAGSTP